MENKTKKSPKWEVKDRMYELTGSNRPIVRIMKRKNLYWFDEDKGYQREMAYAVNQKTPFVDEFKGRVRPGHIIFRDGILFVEKENTVLQQLLSIYHPDKNLVYREVDNEVDAEADLDIFELEIDALNAAAEMEVEQMEAIMRAEIGSNVNKMKSKELRRDTLIFARENPELFLKLAKDEDVSLRNLGIKAVEANILQLSEDNRTFTAGKEKRKLFEVPFDEHPYTALAAWFKTDEGLKVLKSVEKKLK
jgi:hypothetical protein|tara:strand:- start:2302 stop:3048 length:747 start_codon:yes stop_codon:yes gene_type:complete